jgi:cytoskeletal protein CcmA (bactofilin family)
MPGGVLRGDRLRGDPGAEGPVETGLKEEDMLENFFKKGELDMEVKTEEHQREPAAGAVERPKPKSVNTILKGSKLTGNIVISHDLELTGDVEGNITSEQNSNITIKGNCKGNITTRGGSVEIEGVMNDGDIVAGGSVRINGKFSGGRIEAGEKIYINGEFDGKLESNEIEVGPEARGKGELYYKEYVSIHKGADVEGQITRVQEKKKEAKRPPEMKIVEMEQSAQKKSEAK